MPRPDELALSPARRAGAAYVHYTVNETIEGTQFRELPEFGAVPAICDASSELLSRPLPLERCAMIYASAQKNLGPPGSRWWRCAAICWRAPPGRCRRCSTTGGSPRDVR